MTQPLTILMLLALGVLLFGKRLPDIARQIGQGLMEFKSGLSEVATERKQSDKEQAKESDRWELEERESVSERFELPSDHIAKEG